VFDADQCADGLGVVGIVSRASVTEDAVFPFRPPSLVAFFLSKKHQNLMAVTVLLAITHSCDALCASGNNATEVLIIARTNAGNV
jgi:hypothetical protein